MCVYIYYIELSIYVYIYNYILYILGACGFGKRDIAGAGGVAAILGDVHLAEILKFCRSFANSKVKGPL